MRSQRCRIASGSCSSCASGFQRRPEGASLEQIGKKLGLTRERIRQLELTALGRLEERLRTESLPSREKLAGAA